MNTKNLTTATNPSTKQVRKSKVAVSQNAPIQHAALGDAVTKKLQADKELNKTLLPAEAPATEPVTEVLAAIAPDTAVSVKEAEVAVGALPEEAAVAWLPTGTSSLAGLMAAVPLMALAGGGGGGGTGTPSGSSIAAKSLNAALAASSDSGVKGDNITNDNTPAIRGVAAPGSKITLKIDQNGDGIADLTLTAVADAEGNWEATPTQPMADGPYVVVISGVEPSGATTGPVSLPLVIDTGASSVVGALDPASDSALTTDQITNDATPTIKGNGTPGDEITVKVAGQTLTTTVAADGTWSVTPTAVLADGIYSAIVTATDPAGNISAPTEVQVTVDTQINLAATLDPSSDSQTQGDAITRDNTPTISGTGKPGDQIEVTSPTGEKLNTTVTANGTWSVTPTQALAEGGPQILGPRQ
jgi:large repetitive protein